MSFSSFKEDHTKLEVPAPLGDATAFLSYLGISPAELKKIWWRRSRMYRRFEISKAPGKMRIIHAPDRRLKFLQQRILEQIQLLYRVRHAVHGFVANKSVKTNAMAHVKKKYLLNIDLKDFFPSISERRVAGLFVSVGVDSAVSDAIARICCLHGHLPQGAPTSPLISNMICFRMDKELLEFAKANRSIYTRYADDITFSAFSPLSKFFDGSVPAAGKVQPERVSQGLSAIIKRHGFEINPQKIRYADKNSSRIVTGLKINQFVNVDRKFIRNIRAILFSIEQLGHAGAQKKLNKTIGSSIDLELFVRGKISWLQHIRGDSDPVTRSICQKYNKLFTDKPIKLAPSRAEVLDRSVWVIDNYYGDGCQGSAFFLKGVGLVTAAHCVDGLSELEVHHPTKPSNLFRVEVQQRDTDRDLAILKHAIPSTEYFELEISARQYAVGEQCTAVGYPSYGLGEKSNMREGKILLSTIKHGINLIEVSQKLTQGMSGGPLIDDMDKVIGVIHKGGPGEGRDFAIDISVLNAWLAELLIDVKD